ncbi:MAG: YeeE/YedE family protein [Flavobacteriales bacterium]|nr:YeeE/YedE family protein [Flavobacteriales bacterium]
MTDFIDFLRQPMPWYIAGPLIGLMIPLLLITDNRKFGISSSFRHICAACLPKVSGYFKYDWKEKKWNMIFAVGVIAGGFIGGFAFANPEPIRLSNEAIAMFAEWGLPQPDQALIPSTLFSWNFLATWKGMILIVAGGFLVGFGTRYAEGCTSGHSITGLSLLRYESLIATIFFFAGGMLMSNLILPWILKSGL